MHVLHSCRPAGMAGGEYTAGWMRILVLIINGILIIIIFISGREYVVFGEVMRDIDVGLVLFGG